MTFEQWVERLGLGFHPDTRGEDYRPALSDAEIADYETAIEEQFRLDGDPYATAIAVWEKLGLI